DCDPSNSGTKAKLVGTGDFTTIAGTVIIGGSANQLLKCDLSSPNGTSTQSIACVQVNTSGAHVIDGCVIHQCASANTIGIYGNGFDGVTVTNTAFTAGTGVLNCLNALGANWTVKTMDCHPTN